MSESRDFPKLSCSVVVPTCNRSALLVRAVESATIEQTRPPNEIIVVDDCSDVDVREALRTAALGGVPMTIERMPVRSGAPAARNRGASLATGDVLMFMDDDDVWRPGKVDRQLRLLAEASGCGWIYTGMRAMDETDGRQLMYLSENHLSGRLWPDILVRNFVGPTSAVAVRRTCFQDVGGFDVNFPAAQDFDLWIRLALNFPALFDREHNLEFRSKPHGGGRLSSSPANYARAFGYINEKYRAEIDRLPESLRRQWRINQRLLILTKTREAGQGLAFLQGLARLALAERGAVSRMLQAAVSASRRRVDWLTRGLTKDRSDARVP